MKEKQPKQVSGKKGKGKPKRSNTIGFGRVKGFITRTFKSYSKYLETLDRVE